MVNGPAPHALGEQPLVLVPEDLPAVESMPLAERDLPASTYDLLVRTATAFPDRSALFLCGENDKPWREAPTWTYAGLLQRVHQAANAYLSLGLPDGGVVALMLPNLGATYAALLGAQAVGIAQPVNPALAEDHLVDLLTLTRARILLAPSPLLSAELWAKAKRVASRLPDLIAVAAVSPETGASGSLGSAVDFTAVAADQSAAGLAVPVRRRGGDIATYFHTGGTTGVPKVAPHTHASEVYMAWALGCSGAYLDGSVGLSGLPLFHVNAVHVTGLGPFMHGTPVVSLGPLGFRDKALMAEFWQIISHYRVTSFSGVPTVYSALPSIPDGVDLSSLLAGAVGAAPLPSRVRDHFESTTKVPMVEGYGLTEATCASAVTPPLAPRPGSVGVRLPYQHIKAVTVDDEGAPTGDCPPGVTGVLAISGPAVFPGYLRPGPGGPHPDPTGTIFDGWLLTGDLGHLDNDGYVYLTGRAKDLIIRGGHNIDPAVIEDALLAHPQVTAASAVGRPDVHSGEVPVAYVTLAPEAGISEADLLAWAAEHVSERAAAPKSVTVLDALPVTEVGKPYKLALRADAIRRAVADALTGLGEPITVDTVIKPEGIIAVVTITPDTDQAAISKTLGQYAIRWDLRVRL
jgi:fatty-acyl-CoA synthase